MALLPESDIRNNYISSPQEWTDDMWDADATSRYNMYDSSSGRGAYNRNSSKSYATGGGYEVEKTRLVEDLYDGVRSGGSAASRREEELQDFVLRSAYPSLSLCKTVHKTAQPLSAATASAAPRAASTKQPSFQKQHSSSSSSSVGNGRVTSYDVGDDDELEDIIEDSDAEADSDFMDYNKNRKRNKQQKQKPGQSLMAKKRKKQRQKNTVLSDDDDDVGEDIASVPSRSSRSHNMVADHVYDIEDDATPRIILMHDPPHLLMQGMNTSSSSSSSSSSDWSRHGPSASPDALGMLIASFRDPVVIIVSDVSGKDDFFFASERCLPPTVRDRYAPSWMPVCTCVCACTYVYKYVCACMYVCMYVHFHICYCTAVSFIIAVDIIFMCARMYLHTHVLDMYKIQCKILQCGILISVKRH